VYSVYSLGFTWADLRSALQDFTNSNFVESRNGLRWLSHAEASLSNFLYARGIEHRKGRKYADGYTEHSGHRYGIYNLRFLASDDRWMDVEVWGDKPLGLEEECRAKRVLKEGFNQENNPEFLGIGFRDCYEEKRLTDVLEPYIGRIEPFQFDKPTDRLIHTTHWSNADELLEYSPNTVRSYVHAVEESPGISIGRRSSWGQTTFASIRFICSATASFLRAPSRDRLQRSGSCSSRRSDDPTDPYGCDRPRAEYRPRSTAGRNISTRPGYSLAA
jgi:hypothetical protein